MGGRGRMGECRGDSVEGRGERDTPVCVIIALFIHSSKASEIFLEARVCKTRGFPEPNSNVLLQSRQLK